MENLSLYRKYRPHNFDNLVGQDHVRTTLINSFKGSNVAHAYLFTGPRGTGKTSTARIVAKAINCENLKEGFDPCDECDICKDIAQGRLIDLIEIDAASNRGIDEVRDLKEKINFAPTRAKNKVYIIDEVHMMTKEAFNALLKTLEEPPAHVYFILATTEVHKIPETIISRCQRFDFRRINEKALMTRLSFICQKEEIQADDLALEAVSRYAEGGLRDAINLIEQLSVGKKLEFDHVKEILGLSSLAFLEDFYRALTENDITRALKIVDESYHQGLDLRQFTHEFIDLMRKKMLASVYEGQQQEAVRLSEMIVVFQETQQNMEASIPQLPLEIAVVRVTMASVPRVMEEKVVAVAVAVLEPKVVEVAQKVVTEIPVKEAPVVEAERKHQPIVQQNGEISFEVIKENWPRVMERLKRPMLKNSIKDAKLESLEENTLTLKFSAQFHLEKAMESENRVELETVIREVFGRDFKIVAIIKPMEIAPVVAEAAPSESDKLSEAMDIFGGEVVS